MGASKRLAKDIINILGAGHEGWFNKWSSKVVIDGQPTAQVKFKVVDGKESEDLEIFFLPKPLADLPLDKEAVKAVFLARENQQWST